VRLNTQFMNQIISVESLWQKIKFAENGLIPAIAQSIETKEILMLAYMNQESLIKTLQTGKIHYWSRSRQKIWLKGETSGHLQFLEQIYLDCDGDTLLLLIKQIGPACHTGEPNCFFQQITFSKDLSLPEEIK
jgi:phosphoribosyl-AMP cyclohydrolase